MTVETFQVSLLCKSFLIVHFIYHITHFERKNHSLNLLPLFFCFSSLNQRVFCISICFGRRDITRTICTPNKVTKFLKESLIRDLAFFLISFCLAVFGFVPQVSKLKQRDLFVHLNSFLIQALMFAA